MLKKKIINYSDAPPFVHLDERPIHKKVLDNLRNATEGRFKRARRGLSIAMFIGLMFIPVISIYAKASSAYVHISVLMLAINLGFGAFKDPFYAIRILLRYLAPAVVLAGIALQGGAYIWLIPNIFVAYLLSISVEWYERIMLGEHLKRATPAMIKEAKCFSKESEMIKQYMKQLRKTGRELIVAEVISMRIEMSRMLKM